MGWRPAADGDDLEPLAPGDGSVDAVAPVAADAPGRRPRRHAAAAVLAAGAAVLAAGVAGLAVMPGRASGADRLAPVKAFVKARRMASFTDEQVTEYGAGDRALGTTAVDRKRTTGEFELPASLHEVVDGGDTVAERLVAPSGGWARSAAGRAALAAQPWAATRPSGLAEGVAPDAALGAAPLPLQLPDVLDRLRHVVAEGGGRLRATLAATAAADPATVDPAAARVPTASSVAVTLTTGPGGRLDRLRIVSTSVVDGDRRTDRHDLSFADWGEPVSIAPPPPSEVDPTPAIDRRGLAKVADMTILAPTSVPAPWKLASLDVNPADPESHDCEAVTAEYVRADADFAAFERTGDDPPTLSVTSVAARCPWLADIEPALHGAHPAQAGARAVQVVDNVEDNTYSYLSDGVTGALDVGGTHVVASTNAGEPFLLSMLAGLGRLDLAAQPVANLPVH